MFNTCIQSLYSLFYYNSILHHYWVQMQILLPEYWPAFLGCYRNPFSEVNLKSNFFKLNFSFLPKRKENV